VTESCEEFKGNIPDHSIKTKKAVERLRQKFPDYQLSEEFILAFEIKLANNLNGYLKIVEQYRSWIEELNQERRSKYRLPKVARPLSNPRLLQCAYCSNWFKAVIGSSLASHCVECKREWDRVRKKKPNSSGWVAVDEKRKRCCGCAKIRLIDLNKLCKSCCETLL
jgi:hypothetical protein